MSKKQHLDNDEPVFHMSTSKSSTGEIIGECLEIPVVAEAFTIEELTKKLEEAIKAYSITFPEKYQEKISKKKIHHLEITNN
jgi:hypothetical protein